MTKHNQSEHRTSREGKNKRKSDSEQNKIRIKEKYEEYLKIGNFPNGEL